MINKRSLWFLTLFSLILVLSIYYITMPSELLLTSIEETNNGEPTVSVEESDMLVALRVESDETMEEEIERLESVLSNTESSKEEKSEAFDKIKELNNTRAEEENLQKKIEENYKLKSYIKINGDEIKVIINSKKHSSELANNIMRSIQENYDTSKYITVKFQE